MSRRYKRCSCGTGTYCHLHQCYAVPEGRSEVTPARQRHHHTDGLQLAGGGARVIRSKFNGYKEGQDVSL